MRRVEFQSPQLAFRCIRLTKDLLLCLRPTRGIGCNVCDQATAMFVFSECAKCTKCGQLILRKIINIAATRRYILRIKCTELDFGWGSAPDPAGGAHSAFQDP